MSENLRDQHESPEEYREHERELFKNLEGQKQGGLSAADRRLVDPHLPTKEAEQRSLDRWEKGLTKTSRSGAFSVPGAGPAIFPNSLKFASEFIDENTPGKYKPAEEMKPPDERTGPTGYHPTARAVVEDICIDCLKPCSSNYVGGMTFMTKEEAEECGGHVGFGECVLYVICSPCWEAAKELSRKKTPLVLIFDGGLIPTEEVALAQKYGFPVNLHEGTEKTLGQWELVKRADRIMRNLRVLICSAPGKYVRHNDSAQVHHG